MLTRALDLLGLLGEAPRSPHWEALERAFLREHPTCAACGTTMHLQVHHVKPFARYPEDELRWDNLLPLCMGPNECHFVVGHKKNWKTFNRRVRADAAAALAARGHRP